MSNRRMNPALKKVLAAVAVKQVVDRIQEARAPRKSFIRRNLGKLAFLGIGATGLYLFKSGKVEKLMGGGSNGYREEYPAGPGTQPIDQSSSSPDRPLETSRA